MAEGHFNISTTKRVSLENSTDLGRGAAPELKSVEFLSETLLVVEQIDIHTNFTARQMLYLYRGWKGGRQCYATSLVRTSIVLRSNSPPPSLGPLGSRVRGRPLVLRGVDAHLAWVGGALRTASREGSVASLASLGIVFPDPASPPACPARLADKIFSP